MTKYMLTVEVPEDLYYKVTKIEGQSEFITKAIRAYFAAVPTAKVATS